MSTKSHAKSTDEKYEESHKGSEKAYIDGILKAIGPSAPLMDTTLVASKLAMLNKELYSGYTRDAGHELGELLTAPSQGLVLLRDLPIYSTCAHHLLPFFGSISLGYFPRGHIAGLSGIARVIEVYSRRLTLQEELGECIVDKLAELLGARAVFAEIRARHMCMEMRSQKRAQIVTLHGKKGAGCSKDKSDKDPYLVYKSKDALKNEIANPTKSENTINKEMHKTQGLENFSALEGIFISMLRG